MPPVREARTLLPLAVSPGALLAPPAAIAADDPAGALEPPRVEVIATTPPVSGGLGRAGGLSGPWDHYATDDRRQAYTYPDINKNQLAMLAVRGSHFFSDGVLIGANAYLRRYRNRNVSSNVNDNFGIVDAGSGAVDGAQASNDRSLVEQTGYGAGLQLTQCVRQPDPNLRPGQPGRRAVSRGGCATRCMGRRAP